MKRTLSAINYALLILFALTMIFPFYWLLRSSFMNQSEIFLIPIKWLPSELKWSNYKEALTVVPFALYFKNTLFLVAVNVLGAVFSNSFVAFGFARIAFKTRQFWFAVVLLTMMLPAAVMLIPQFVGWKLVGGYNTYMPLTIPAFFGSAFYIFLLRQFYSTIPHEYDEAAYVDGANYLQIYWKILLPLSKPALMTVGLFTFMGVWNDFFGPLLYLNDNSKWNLSLGLQSFIGEYVSQWELLMAGATVVLIPLVIVFFFTQKTFIEGVALTGVKG